MPPQRGEGGTKGIDPELTVPDSLSGMCNLGGEGGKRRTFLRFSFARLAARSPAGRG